jgi:mannose-1-phosphate guanylyltransferase
VKAILLAAGYGSRLAPITLSIPKCLVQIHGRELLDIWLARLEKSGVSEVLLNLHYLPEKIIDFLNHKSYSLKIKLSYESVLLGTAGTILKNRDFFYPEPVLVIHADNLSLVPIGEFFSAHKNYGDKVAMTMMTFLTDSPQDCGIISVGDDGIVTSFFEKSSKENGNLANGAIYIINNEVVEFLGRLEKKAIDFSNEVIPFFIGKIGVYHNKIYHRDIGTHQSLKKAMLELTKQEIYSL